MDITETLTRKGPDAKLVRQQNNHDTLLQACSLRANVSIINCKANVEEQYFGSANSNRNRFWTMALETDFPYTEDMLIDDLNFLPILIGLDETGLIHNNVVLTKDPVYKNTIFLIGE